MKRGFLDVQSPVFRPVWLRAAIVAVVLGWAIFEAASGGVFWFMLFGAAGLYLGYQFFVVWDPKDPEDKDEA